MPMTARTVELVARPLGASRPTDFRLASLPLPEPVAGEVALQTLWLSLDPYMRGRMNERRSYAPPMPFGQPLPCGAVARVLHSNDPALARGVHVGNEGLARLGCRQAALGRDPRHREHGPGLHRHA